MNAPLVCDNLSYTPIGSAEPILRNVSARAAAGAWTVVTGRTGSGKTTLLLALAGILQREGAGTLSGAVADINTLGGAGVVFQRPADAFCCESVGEEVAFGLENIATPPDDIRARVSDALSAVGLTDHAATNVLHLSGGQQQGVALACALASDARWLVLDEPCSELDPAATRAFLALVDRLRRERGLSIVQAEHRLDSVMPYADALLILDAGTPVWEGAFLDACADGDVLRAHGLEVPGLAALCHGRGIRAAPRDRDEALRMLGDAALDPPETGRAPEDEPVQLRLTDLAAGHGRRGPPVVEGLSWTVRRGQRWAVLGANGAGKSTVLHTIAGLLRPLRGTITFGDAEDAARGLVLQDPVLMLTEPTAADEIRLGCAPETAPDTAAQWLLRVGLGGRGAEPPLGLSHGERARLALAAAAAPEPPILLLDEPATGQDRAHLNQLLSLLALEGGSRTLIFSTHDWDTALSLATHALVLADGRAILQGTVADALHAAARGELPSLPLPDALALCMQRGAGHG